eukprot:c3468_g1_i1.p1 GENE.c3468_g1_i1~~c3468_g1_i1.p1  ORF type:complete len:318 (+),score=53.51 c3468_g1_i1:30-983(+)
MLVECDFEGQRVWKLSSDAACAIIAPQFGARLFRFTVGETEVIVWPANSDYSSVTKVRGGNPILFPVVARHYIDGQVGKARYPGDDQIYDLPMHGFARDSKFEVAKTTDTSISLLLSSNEETRKVYPFEFNFVVTYALIGTHLDELAVEFRTTNIGNKQLPNYPGHHFYFAISHTERANWQLDIPCLNWGRQNPDGSVFEKPRKEGPIPLSDNDLIDNFHLGLQSSLIFLNNTATGRSIEINLESPTPWFNVTTWALSDTHDHYCVEPWLGLPNAVSHGKGLRMLAVGAEEVATCSIRVKDPGNATKSALAEFNSRL